MIEHPPMEHGGTAADVSSTSNAGERPMVLLGTRTVAKMLGYAPATVLRKAQAGVIPSFKLPGGAIRYDEDAIKAWLEKHRRGAS